MLTGNQIRKEFIEFFKKKNHKHFESASLIPDDPTLLLTVAGMVPFKPYFLGQKEAPCPRVTTYQKSIRTNDLENVGRTARHHTFFEMLGNFSFGDYFKEEAIVWSWEFVTEVLKLDKDKLWVSVFTTDDEAEQIWIEKCNFPKERIVRMGEDENWWAAGPTGSCGPCSEIHVDLGVAYGGDENSKLGDEGTDNRFIEIWNLVFTEWNRMEDGSLQPLPKKNIDTGAGLERVTAMVQGKSNNFETDLLFPIVEEAGRLTSTKYGESKEKDFSLKVITDHSRAVTFLINDGVIPSNEGRGYVLRRILRRAVRHGRLLGQTELFLYKMVDKVVEIMEEAYPDLRENIEHIQKVVKIEEENFSRTLAQGIQLVTQEIENLKKNNLKKLSGEITFKMYDTYGFPYELTEEICEENNIEISREEFETKMEEQKEKARNAREIIMEKGQDDFIEEFYDKYGATEFTGYTSLEENAKILSIRDGKTLTMIFEKTPFYAEAGGQAGDVGTIVGEKFSGKIVDVQKQKGIYIHSVELENGEAKEGDSCKLSVDAKNRKATEKNHTATHLLHKALREVLGAHVQQAGSFVNGERLRFDFNHYEAMTKDELKRVEALVNEKIFEGLDVEVKNMSMDEAKKAGAMALFGDKYGDVVRVVKVDDFSIELCGGTHIDNIGKIGMFKIESENGVAAGVRRIEAVTGLGAYKLVEKLENSIKEIAKITKTDEGKIVERIEKLSETLKENAKEIETLKNKLTSYEVNALFDGVEEINGVKVVIKSFKEKNAEELRTMVDTLKEKLGSCVIALGSGEDKAIFATGVTKDLISKVKAGDLVKEAAQIAGGNGGGRPDFAQAGGKDATKIQEALQVIREKLKSVL